ncbi:MAG: FtsX-like permease family protein, partial [Terriglobales bacterium]
TAVLLLGAGLLWQGLRQIEHTDPGFNPQGVLTYRASLLFNSLQELNANAVFFQRLDQQLPTLPGVQSAGAISALPFVPADARMHFYVMGTADARLPMLQQPEAGLRRVLPGYFRTMAIPVQGREFRDNDSATSQAVVMLSASLARRLFPRGDALRHAIHWGVTRPLTAQIVGVAGDVPARAPGGPPALDIYLPYMESPSGDLSFVVRTSGDVFSQLGPAQRLMTQLNPQIPAYAAASLEQTVAATTAGDRFRAHLLLAMAGLALLLAVAGLYGVLAHSVALRHREIGIRMALGASPLQLRGWVLLQSLRMMGWGVAAGLLAAWLLRHSLDDLLQGAASPLPWVAVPALLLAVGAIASYLPARHATRVDPAITLKGN